MDQLTPHGLNSVSKLPRRTAPHERLDKTLLPQASDLIESWTGHAVSRSGDELTFLNTARGDNTLGSAKFNLTTGVFVDNADNSFKGKGLVRLYSLLHEIPLTLEGDKQSVDALLAQDSVTKRQSVTLTKPIAPTPKPPVVAVQESDESIVLPPDMHPELGMPTMVWKYMTRDGNSVAFYVYRFDLGAGRKETRPCAYSAELKRWLWQYPAGQLPLYQSQLVESGKPVIVVEGEKAADAAQAQFPDFVVVTSCQGSGRASASDWSVLVGTSVLICPDNDEAGFKYALDVTSQLLAHGGISVRIKDVRTLGWESGDDLADHQVGSDFFDETKPFQEVFTQRQLEPSLVNAASFVELGDYARSKKRLAELLGVGSRDLDAMVRKARGGNSTNEEEFHQELLEADPEPWDDPVDGAEVFQAIKGLVMRHVVLQDEQATAVAGWVMYSYVFNQLNTAPILLLTSASPRCGKSTLMELVSGLVSNPMPVANISAATVYRMIEAYKPTLLMDEADTFLSQNEEVAGILNCGHTKRFAFVARCEKNADGSIVPMKFSTFCPKVIAMIALPKSTALLDRCIAIRLVRATKDSKHDPLPIDVSATYLDLRRKLVRWADDNRAAIVLDTTTLSRGSNDRAFGNWSTLVSAVKSCGAVVVDEVAQAFRGLNDVDRYVENTTRDLLTAAYEIAKAMLKDEFQSVLDNPQSPLSGNRDLIASKYLVAEMNKMSHMAWADFSNGKGLTEHKLGRYIKPFDIRADQATVNGRVVRGYRVGSFVDVWARYGIPAESEHYQANS